MIARLAREIQTTVGSTVRINRDDVIRGSVTPAATVGSSDATRPAGRASISGRAALFVPRARGNQENDQGGQQRRSRPPDTSSAVLHQDAILAPGPSLATPGT